MEKNMRRVRRPLAILALITAAVLPGAALTASATAASAVVTPAAPTRLSPRVPADSNGYPRQRCGPENDGQRVETEDAHGGRHLFVCKFVNDLFGPDGWEWNEILLM
jgi:hypothetical protein